MLRQEFDPEIVVVSMVGSVRVISPDAVQLFSSVTVTEYVPAPIARILIFVDPVDHKNV